MMSQKGLAQREKAKSQLAAAIRRPVNRVEYRKLVEAIRSGDAKFVERLGPHETKFFAVVDDVPLSMVYDSNRQLVSQVRVSCLGLLTGVTE